MQAFSPVSKNEREIFMDVLRGFALLGIFLANLNAFTWWHFVPQGTQGPFFVPAWDKKMEFLHHMFLEGKFYSIFSLLFGWGMAIQVIRLQAQGIQSVFIIRKRLAVLLILGAIHLLIWPGDIVFFYALLGFVLLWFRNVSAKRLVWIASVLIISPVLLYWLKMKFHIFNLPVEKLYEAGDWTDRQITHLQGEAAFRSYIRKADWVEILKADIPGFFFRYADLFFQSRISKVLGMMILGMAIGKSNFYKQIAARKNMVTGMLVAGLLIGLPANYLLAQFMANDDGSYYNLTLKGWHRTIAYAIGVAPLALAYASAFALLFQMPFLKRALAALAPVGRMAFSNYLFQTLVGNFVFYNAGLGYMEKVGPVFYTLFGLLVFVLQVILSTAWLQRFSFGPVEWLWRSATYGKWQPMRLPRG